MALRGQPYLRVYAACTAQVAGHAPGSVTYLLINLYAREPATLRLETPGEQARHRVTAPSLDSREVQLNLSSTDAALAIVRELEDLLARHSS